MMTQKQYKATLKAIVIRLPAITLVIAQKRKFISDYAIIYNFPKKRTAKNIAELNRLDRAIEILQNQKII